MQSIPSSPPPKVQNGLLPAFHPDQPASFDSKKNGLGHLKQGSAVHRDRAITIHEDGEGLSPPASSPPSSPMHFAAGERYLKYRNASHVDDATGLDFQSPAKSSRNPQMKTFYPTPAPSSASIMSSGLLSSGPMSSGLEPPAQEKQSSLHEPESEPTYASLDARNASFNVRSPLSTVTIIRIPTTGAEVKIGRSSKSSDVALSRNKLVSRVHLKAHYEADTETLVIDCVGWNGVTVTVPTYSHLDEIDVSRGYPTAHGQSDYTVAKGQTIHIEYVPGISLDIRGERALIELLTHKDEDETEDEVDILSPVREPEIYRDLSESPKSEVRVEVNAESPELPVADQPEQAPAPQTVSTNGAEEKSGQQQSLDLENSKEPVDPQMVWPVPDALSHAGNANAELEVTVSDNGLDNSANSAKDEPGTIHKPKDEVAGDSKKLQLKAASKEPPAKNIEPQVDAQSGHSADHKRKVPAFKRKPEPLSERSNSANNTPSPQPKRTHTGPKKTAKTGKELVKPQETQDTGYGDENESIEGVDNIDQLKNVIANFLAFSRLNSSPLSAIQSSNNSLRDLTAGQIRTLLNELPHVGIIPRSGKDAAGKLLEEEYYYIPDRDSDESRQALVRNSRGGAGLRSCRKTHKQYFWKKPTR